MAITVISLAVLWAFYGFRYAARPNSLQLNPPLAAYVQDLKPHETWLITTLARWHVLPESYLYGLADVRLTANFYTSYVLGKIYAHGVWFYFPIAFLIKSTIAFMALLLLAIVATAVSFWGQSATAALLFTPYLAWTTFAAFLNFAIWRMY